MFVAAPAALDRHDSCTRGMRRRMSLVNLLLVNKGDHPVLRAHRARRSLLRRGGLIRKPNRPASNAIRSTVC